MVISKLPGIMKITSFLLVASMMLLACQQQQKKRKEQGAFPFFMSEEKPDRPLSAAVERNYDAYPAIRPEQNELYTQFKYTPLKGFDYNGGDGTITRRDPSKIIFENGRYYVWYTYRNTPVKPVGMSRAKEANDTIPSSDWDLADIWYATSEDGFTWGRAGPRRTPPSQAATGMAFGSHYGYPEMERQVLSLLSSIYGSKRIKRGQLSCVGLLCRFSRWPLDADQ